MSSLSGGTVDLLNGIADMQNEVGSGFPIRFAEVFGLQEVTPAAIKEAFNRNELNGQVPALVDQTLGDAMTVGDEVSVAAAWERAVQNSFQGRIRKMAHANGRSVGHGATQGIFRYGMQEIMARPE